MSAQGNGAGGGRHRTGAREISLRDVAHRAGVSVSTASRVLSGSTHPVSETARGRVLAAADALGFEPNRLARALATARSQTIGVVVHDVADPYFAEIVRGMEDVAGPLDHALFVASSDRDPTKELGLIRAFVSHQVDAIVLAASGLVAAGYNRDLAGLLDRFRARGGVVVVLAEHSYPAPRVMLDNEGAAAMAVEHLVALGHRRIGFLSGPPELAVSAARQRGYVGALADAGLDHDPGLVECGWFSMDRGAEAVARLMASAPPTAIVAANDLMAFGAMRTLLDAGVDVPTDVSVVGIDDIGFAGYASVPLTTVRIPMTELGRRGADLVMRLLAGDEAEPLPSVHLELVERSSSGPVPVDGPGTTG